jgi:outer membrane protein OmpA-like peptidoglycan-associated protein
MSTAALAALPVSVTTATPASQVIESQCPILPEFPALPTDRPARLLLRIAFTPDQSDLVACDQEEIKRVAALLEASPQAQAVIEGHADNSGLEWWNQILSESRAQSVYNALTQNFAVAPDRLKMKGFGSTRPVDSNETVDGRARNRRVEIVIEYGPSSRPRIPRASFMPGMNQ